MISVIGLVSLYSTVFIFGILMDACCKKTGFVLVSLVLVCAG